MMKPGTTALLLALLPAALRAEPIPVRVELQPAEITVGDRVTARLTLVWDGEEPSARPRFPAWGETWGTAEVLDVGDVESFPDPAGRHVYRQELLLTAFEVGEIQLPSLDVSVPLTEESVQVPIRGAHLLVRSVLPHPEAEDVEEPKLKPLAPFQALPGGLAFIWTTVALLAACAGAGVLLRRRLATLGEMPAPAFEGHVLAPLEELAARLDAVDAEQAEPAHTAVSAALRAFLGRTLGFQAAESTTSEIQRRLRSSAATPAHAQRTVQLLRACDGVKFARQEVDRTVTLERLEAAREIGREIDEALRPRYHGPVGEEEAAA
jgi:hypothetical protein